MNSNEIIQRFKYSDKEYQESLIPTVLSVIIFTRQFFDANEDLKIFTREYLKKDYKAYLFKSRTLLYSRIVKDLYIKNPNLHDTVIILSRFFKTFNNISEKTSTRRIGKKRTSQQNIIHEWRRVINPEENDHK